MITPELTAKIRRLFYAEHWMVGTIAAELGLHHDAVERANGTTHFVNTAFRASSSVLDPYMNFVRMTLEQYPRLRSTRLLQMIQARGYPGSVWPLRRFVRRASPASPHEAFFRLSTLPGEQAQVDWGSFGSVMIGNTRRALSGFVMVPHGRAPSLLVSFSTRQSRVSFAATSQPSRPSAGFRARCSTTI